MKNIELVVPKLEEYYYEQKLEEDPKTMSYNKGYNVSYDGYHYDTGCIDFPKDKWKASYEKRIKDMKPYLKKGIFKKLKDINIFNSVEIKYGTISWGEDLDMCADSLYDTSEATVDN